MPEDHPISDDPGTILDSFDSILKNLPVPPPAALPSVRHPAPPTEEVLYKSPYRWTAPRILICDDDSLDQGETFYLRSDKAVIGRTKGNILIGHDVAMSAAHAEVVRQDAGGRATWILRDLGSSNGTLVRAKTITLKPTSTVLIGSKRYRFEHPGAAHQSANGTTEPGTALLADLGVMPTDALPALVESIALGSGEPARHPFKKTVVRIGRPGIGNEIEIDDLCLAGTHAVVRRDYSGVWQIEAQPSMNGVWVKVEAIRLVDQCLFQCGEQRFRFHL